MKLGPTKLVSPRDINFLLFDWLKVHDLTTLPHFHHLSTQDFDAVLDLCFDLAENEFATHNRESDTHEPEFDGTNVTMIPQIKSALDAFYDAGVLAAQAPMSVDGGQLPQSVYRACYSFFQAANLATAAYPMLSAANANLLLAHGSQEQIDTYVLPMLEGRFFGTMCLSEPQAGSSLADILTRAVPQDDGTYRVTGNKMWISGGDHELSENIVHLVLAKCPGAPAGVRGLSLFIVPKFLVNADGTLGERNDVVLAGINHKMGYRGTVNTVLNFGDSGQGAIGYLVGEENRGLEYMFHMMNEARIGVGAGAVSVAYSSYLHALDYAKTRGQGRPVDDKDPHAAQTPIINHPDVRRMLLASKSYVEGGLALVLYAAKVLDEAEATQDEQESKASTLLLDILTPIVKGWTSKWSLVANDYAIQIHGGYGYTREYPVEQLWRDNRLNPIHEGTDGIQAIDLVGRKVSMQDSVAFTILTDRIKDTIARAHGVQPEYAQQLTALLESLTTVTRKLIAADKLSERIANASLYADAFGHIVIGWMWLEQLLALGDLDDNFAAGKRLATEYFFTYELANASQWLDIVSRNPLLFTRPEVSEL